MGLHINYQLFLPGDTSDDDALALLESLRAFAATLNVEPMSPVLTFTAQELAGDFREREHGQLDWFLHLLVHGMREHRESARGIDDGLGFAAFLMNPGEGSESATFGFVRPLKGVAAAVDDHPGAYNHWYWRAFCKTQYASNISDDHLVRCHLSIVQVLEEAERLGVRVEVHDETRYWETRSTDVLIREVRNMNRIVARFAGKLDDAIGPEHPTQAPIFEHPEFERLEMEPVDPPPWLNGGKGDEKT